jgi:AcrR family transcriptional regulator
VAHRSIDRGTAAPSVWLRPQRGSRGPASQWTRDDVAETGVSLADAGGLEAVTMRSIAARLGTAGASLYRIVDSRDQVLELMADRAIGEFDYADTPPGSGGVGLMRLAVQARAIYARHPWLLASATADPVLGPNSMTYLDHALGTLADTRLSRRQRLEAVGIVAGLVRVLALDEAEPGPGRLSPAWQDALTSYLRDGTNPDTHPHLSQAMHGSEPAAESTGDRFEAVVGLVIAALLSTDQ